MAEEIRGEASLADAVYVRPVEEPSGLPHDQLVELKRSRLLGHHVEEAAKDSDGFALDTETLERLAEKWEDFRDRYYKALEDAAYLTQAESPGLDYASVGFTEKVQASGRALETALWERVEYCERMRDKFLAALGRYSGAEEEAEAAVTKEKGKFG